MDSEARAKEEARLLSGMSRHKRQQAQTEVQGIPFELEKTSQLTIT